MDEIKKRIINITTELTMACGFGLVFYYGYHLLYALTSKRYEWAQREYILACVFIIVGVLLIVISSVVTRQNNIKKTIEKQ